jgi:hypothetical protein
MPTEVEVVERESMKQRLAENERFYQVKGWGFGSGVVVEVSGQGLRFRVWGCGWGFGSRVEVSGLEALIGVEGLGQMVRIEGSGLRGCGVGGLMVYDRWFGV